MSDLCVAFNRMKMHTFLLYWLERNCIPSWFVLWVFGTLIFILSNNHRYGSFKRKRVRSFINTAEQPNHALLFESQNVEKIFLVFDWQRLVVPNFVIEKLCRQCFKCNFSHETLCVSNLSRALILGNVNEKWNFMPFRRHQTIWEKVRQNSDLCSFVTYVIINIRDWLQNAEMKAIRMKIKCGRQISRGFFSPSGLEYTMQICMPKFHSHDLFWATNQTYHD